MARAPVKRPELNCFGHAEACRCCRLERCNSRVLIGPGYKLASMRVPSSAGDVCGGWPVYGNCTIAPQLTRACRRQGADQERLPVPSSHQLAVGEMCRPPVLLICPD